MLFIQFAVELLNKFPVLGLDRLIKKFSSAAVYIGGTISRCSRPARLVQSQRSRGDGEEL